MALQGCYGCLKTVVFVFNLIFWCLGIGLLAFALWLRLDPRMKHFVSGGYGDTISVYYSACYVLMAAGGLMTIVGFLGCCGAYQESKWMLGSFFCFLVAIFILETAGGIWAYVHEEEMHNTIKENMRLVIHNDYGNAAAGKKVEDSVDYIQSELKCCGGMAPSDYVLSHWVTVEKTRQGTLPESCCVKGTNESTCLTKYVGIYPEIYSKGCGLQMIQIFKDHLLIIVAVALGIACLEMFGMCLTLMLCCALLRGEGMPKPRESRFSVRTY